jgi:hypothetical protein
VNVTIEAKKSIEGFISKLSAFPRQVAFAESLALNRTANLVKVAEKAEIARAFDRPTSTTLNSVLVLYSNKDQPVREVIIKLKDKKGGFEKGTAPADYLHAEIYGGAREQKRSETAMQNNTILFAATGKRRLVASRMADKDNYGNIKRGQMTKILSDLKAFSEVGYTANVSKESRKKNKKRKTSEYFIRHVGRGTETTVAKPVVYQRIKGGGIKPVLVAVKKAEYKKRFKFFEVLEDVWDKNLQREYDVALVEAVEKTFK